MEHYIDSGLTRLYWLPVVTVEPTLVVQVPTLVPEMEMPWLSEPVYHCRILNSFNSTLLVSTVLDV
jgi:hypothetical protein